jgi:hypothetical protein
VCFAYTNGNYWGEGAEAHEQIHEQILEIKFKNIHIGLKVGTTLGTISHFEVDE